MRDFLVDVPVRVMIWTRPDFQRQQFEVIKKAAPSVLFLVSDGGRNEYEKKKIEESRKIFENIDWKCEVHKLYFDDNQGLYSIFKIWHDYIWERVDRCIFLEDDYIPSISFFQFCAEMLEKYKDDTRIEMITGNNVFETYSESEPYDYFFTQTGWSIWGTATWKRVAQDYEFPLDYRDNEYIKKSLKQNLTPFWYKKVLGYCNGRMVDNHIPGTEYYHAVNSALYHRLSIVPTKNMIKNIGFIGEHAKCDGKNIPKCFNVKTYELTFPIRHPKYVIDDKKFGELYEKFLDHQLTFRGFFKKCTHVIKVILSGKLFSTLKRRRERRKNLEK